MHHEGKGSQLPKCCAHKQYVLLISRTLCELEASGFAPLCEFLTKKGKHTHCAFTPLRTPWNDRLKDPNVHPNEPIEMPQSVLSMFCRCSL